MDKQEINYSEKVIEKNLSHIGAKVAKATELVFQSRQIAEESNKLLIDAQTEISDLYIALGELLPGWPAHISTDTEDTSEASAQSVGE